MADYYCNLGTGTDGAGTPGDPWTSLEHALVQTISATSTLHVSGDTTASETVSAKLQIPAAGLTIQPASGWEPTDTGPQLTITGAIRYSAIFQIESGDTDCVIDGFNIFNTRTQDTSYAVLVNETGCILKNCVFKVNHVNSPHIYSTQTFTVENCLFLGASGLKPAQGLWLYSTNRTATIKNCAFVYCVEGIECRVSGAVANVYSSLFYECTTDGDTGTAGTYNSYSCATTKATAETWDTNSWTTSISTTNGVDCISPSTDDFRAASGGNLENTGDATNSTTTDMFGVTRDDPDIGYSEYVATGPDISTVMHHYLKNLG